MGARAVLGWRPQLLPARPALMFRSPSNAHMAFVILALAIAALIGWFKP